MAKKSVLIRVHPEFKKIVNNSDMSSRDFTKSLSEKLWEEKFVKKRRKGLGGFRI